MGMFSFKTQDTNKSISNIYSERETFKVIMTDNKGNQYTETAYDGYGDFGNVDFYALTDIMNGGNGDRERGIKIYFDKQYISKNIYFRHYLKAVNITTVKGQMTAIIKVIFMMTLGGCINAYSR